MRVRRIKEGRDLRGVCDLDVNLGLMVVGALHSDVAVLCVCAYLYIIRGLMRWLHRPFTHTTYCGTP